MDLSVIIEMINTGADVALIVIAYAIWRLDRRVYKLEVLAEREVRNA